MTNYIKDEIETINSTLKIAEKYKNKSKKIKEIKQLLIAIKEIFVNDEKKDEINSIYDNLPLVYVSFSCEIKKIRRII